jgi:hypothetical protein
MHTSLMHTNTHTHTTHPSSYHTHVQTCTKIPWLLRTIHTHLPRTCVHLVQRVYHGSTCLALNNNGDVHRCVGGIWRVEVGVFARSVHGLGRSGPRQYATWAWRAGVRRACSVY